MNPFASRFADAPSLIAPQAASQLGASLAAAAAQPDAGRMLSMSTSEDGFWPPADSWLAAYRPYIVRDGILHIPVKGVLLHDFPFAFGSFATGYTYIGRALDRGLADATVRGLAFICDSPGGQGAGCFTLADKVFAARGIKPMRAFANVSAYSAAYAIASATDRIIVERSGGVGSIGVVMTHIDASRAFDQMGLSFTFVTFGKHKVDGNATQPLPDDVKARWQELCRLSGESFVALVARSRAIDATVVRDTEAACFTAAEAVENGLADEIGSLEDAVAAFANDPSAADDDEGDEDMSGNNAAAPAALSAAALEAATATSRAEGHAAGRTEGLAEGEKKGVSTERTRISAILGGEEATGRGALAHHLAFESDMSADDAKKLLAKSPKETAAAPADRLDAALRGTNPQVGADATGDKNEATEVASLAGNIITLYTGKPPKAA